MNPWFPLTLHKEQQKCKAFNTVTSYATLNQIEQM